MRLRLRVRLALASLACIWALVLPAATSSGAGTGICTLVGCESGASVVISNIRKVLPEARRVQICLDEKCRSASARYDLMGVRDRDLTREERVNVSMRVRGGGEVLGEDRISTKVRKLQPNGPQCPPTCFHASLEVGRDLKLHKFKNDNLHHDRLRAAPRADLCDRSPRP